MEKVMISACLAGIKCKYNGKNSCERGLVELLNNKQIIVFCPEILGGLSTPRAACNIHNGDGADVIDGNAKVIGIDEVDYTKYFVEGAKKALEIALENNVKTVYLKQNSPSCGCGKIYSPDGKNLIEGNGVLAALLIKNSINVVAANG